MDGQDWTPVTFRRRTASKKEHNIQPRDYKKDEKIQMSKLENSDKPIIKKRISPESLQALIRKRIELTLSQIKADAKCSFPRNTFKNIEATRLIPSEEQRRRIQQHFGIPLKINTYDT
jgi:ribosome-binding protein aMBF1 (putative translation factor)